MEAFSDDRCATPAHQLCTVTFRGRPLCMGFLCGARVRLPRCRPESYAGPMRLGVNSDLAEIASEQAFLRAKYAGATRIRVLSRSALIVIPVFAVTGWRVGRSP